MKTIQILLLCLLIGITSAIAQRKHAKTDSLMVYGNCSQCKDRIENALKDVGIAKANWDIDTKMLTVTFDSSRYSLAGIQKRLAEVGHDTKTIKATDAAYNKLPSCCKYERELSGLGTNATIDSAHASIAAPIMGVVLEENKKGMFLPISNATIRQLTSAYATVTDSLGVFKLPYHTLPTKVVVSFVGYVSDTLTITNTREVKVILRNDKTHTLQEVTVKSGRGFSSYVSTVSTLNTLNIGSREIAKAACCNLSESFETTPSVDVSYSDAVTGIKQIQLLGLSGNYTQITTENIPEIRGLAGAYGLTFIPGPWLESVQVTKGTGSVANGYESIAGQINLSLIHISEPTRPY